MYKILLGRHVIYDPNVIIKGISKIITVVIIIFKIYN